MGSTLINVQIHAIFGTKDCLPLIADAWRGRLHSYMAGCATRIKAFPIEIGGVDDHVHVLLGLRATHRIADVLRDIKAPSSEWVHGEMQEAGFGWQDGYAAYSISNRDIPSVRAYIRNQEEHHRRKTFREEYVEFLERHGVPYDARYVL